MKTKQWLSVLLCILMCTSMLTVTVYATEDYGFSIYDGSSAVNVTSDNASDVLGDNTISYNATSNTLTLNNATLTSPYAPDSNAGTYVESAINVKTSGQSLNIELIGENTITGGRCIYVNGSLNISGNGSLIANGQAFGVNAIGNLTIDGAVVTASTSTNAGNGINTYGTLTIQNNANVTGTSSGANGISGSTGITIIESEVTGISTSNGEYDGISSQGNISITDSNVSAKSVMDAGLAAYNGDLTITNSTVEAMGECDADEYGFCAICGNKIKISGGSVTATETGKEANAIYSGSIEITNGATVIAKATNAESYPAIYGTGGVSTSNSTIKAKSGGDVAIYSPASVNITDDSNVIADGYYAGICGESDGVSISDSEVKTTSSNDVALWSKNDIDINNSIIEATGKDGTYGIYSSQGNISIKNHSDVTSYGGIKASNTITIVPDSDTLVEVKVNDRVNGDTNATHYQDSPYSESLTLDGAALTSYTFVHIKDHIHTGGTATCTTLAICSDCGNTYGSLDASNHSNLVKTEAVSATHTNVGNTEYWYCDGCDKYFSDEAGSQGITLEETVISKLTEHTTDGTGWYFDETSHWNICECGEKMNEASHTFVWITDKEATETEAGSKHEECTVCGYKKDAVEIPAIGTQSDTNTLSDGQTGDTTSPETTMTTGTTVNSSSTDTEDGIQTGDETNTVLWIGVMIMTIGIIVIVISERKRKCNRLQYHK